VSGKKGMRRWGQYVPAPDSLVELAVYHLQSLPLGTELETRQLTTAIGISARNAHGSLDCAVKHGWITRRHDGPRTSPTLWSLGPNAPRAPNDPPEADDAGEWPKQTIVKASDAKLTHKLGPASVFDLAHN
jgi:hypothetical protein